MKKAASVLVFFAIIAGVTVFLRTFAMRDQEKAQAANELEIQFAVTQKAHQEAALEDRISRCEVWVGMTRADLIKSWGNPGHTNTTARPSGESQQLVYRHNAGSMPVHRCGSEALPKRAHVYVAGGVVTAIQNHE